jgi:hypothetical protein
MINSHNQYVFIYIIRMYIYIYIYIYNKIIYVFIGAELINRTYSQSDHIATCPVCPCSAEARGEATGTNRSVMGNPPTHSDERVESPVFLNLC